MENYGPDIVTLVDEEGEEMSFEMLDTMELDGSRYAALIPVLEEDEILEDSGELIVLKVVTDENGDEFLETIEDEAVFDKVSAMFMERLEDEWEFVDEDGEPVS